VAGSLGLLPNADQPSRLRVSETCCTFSVTNTKALLPPPYSIFLLKAVAMSAAKPEQPAQETLNAAPVVGAHNLDALQSMLNLIFLQSGRFIKEHQSGGGTGRMKLAMQRAVPVATERFHDALDELENEVRLAQVVMRRDLALLKQDRKRREIAAKEKEAEKARLAAESRNIGTLEKQQEPVVEKVETPAQPEIPAQEEPEKESEPEKMPEREEEHAPPSIDTLIGTTTERDPLFDGTPTTANPQENEFDFDAMFGDAMDTTGDTTNQDDLMDTSGNMDFNFDEGPSLLRGLEDFAKDSDDDNTNSAQTATNMDLDLTMPDLPDLSSGVDVPPPNEQPVATKAATPQPPTTTQPPPVEPSTTTTTTTTNNNEPASKDTPTNIDTTNQDTTTANDDIMGGMMTDNLDDLFNMDEYENPEQSSFDDAFFNFE
jgi:hypothetical protein